MKSSLFIYLLIIANLLITIYSAKAQSDEWHMVSKVSDSVPVPQKWIELCKTDSGKRIIIETLDLATKYDIMCQWLGIKMQDSLRLLSIGQKFSGADYKPTLDQYYLETAQRFCTPLPGGQLYKIQDPNKIIFYLEGPLFCESRNSGGGTKYDCNSKIVLMLPDGWQVCKFFFEGNTVRHGKFRFEPIFRQYDSQNPARILGHNLYLTGHGDVGNPSSAYVRNIKVYAIKSNLDNKYREECGCIMPFPEILAPPSATKPETKPTTTPAKISYAIMNKSKDGHSAFLVIVNEGGTSGILQCKIVYQDKYTGAWKKYQEGGIAISPYDSISTQMTLFDAIDWKFEYDYIVDIKK